MARASEPLSHSFGTEEHDGWLDGIVADEDDLDRSTLWRLGLWGFAAISALTLGILSGQLPVNAQRTEVVITELAVHARQVDVATQATQLEALRLAAAIETLNSDRDRLFTRLSSLEQGLDVVTGSIRKAEDKPSPWPDYGVPPMIEPAPLSIAAPEKPAAEPVSNAVAENQPAPTTLAARSEAPPPEVPSQPPSIIQAMPIPDVRPRPVESEPRAEETPVPLTEFGLDVGMASSVNGLRALWRGLNRSHRAQLEGLKPLIAVREPRNGLGLQLRLVVGPIRDAAAAARICAVLINASRECRTTAFDGQKLSLTTEPENAAPARPPRQRKSTQRPPANQQASSLVSLIGVR